MAGKLDGPPFILFCPQHAPHDLIDLRMEEIEQTLASNMFKAKTDSGFQLRGS